MSQSTLSIDPDRSHIDSRGAFLEKCSHSFKSGSQSRLDRSQFAFERSYSAIAFARRVVHTSSKFLGGVIVNARRANPELTIAS